MYLSAALDQLDRLRAFVQDNLQPVLVGLMVLMVFLGPAICGFAARMTRSFKPWAIKLAGMSASTGAMISANWVVHFWAGENFTWYVWLPDAFFVLSMLGWLRRPMVQLRAGSADSLDDKIQQMIGDGWDTLIFRWVPSTGVHRGLLTKRTDRRKTGPVPIPPGVAAAK